MFCIDLEGSYPIFNSAHVNLRFLFCNLCAIVHFPSYQNQELNKELRILSVSTIPWITVWPLLI